MFIEENRDDFLHTFKKSQTSAIWSSDQSIIELKTQLDKTIMNIVLRKKKWKFQKIFIKKILKKTSVFSLFEEIFSYLIKFDKIEIRVGFSLARFSGKTCEKLTFSSFFAVFFGSFSFFSTFFSLGCSSSFFGFFSWGFLEESFGKKRFLEGFRRNLQSF